MGLSRTLKGVLIMLAGFAASSVPGSTAFAGVDAVGITSAALAAAIDQHVASTVPRLKLLWSYYRNPMQPRAGWGSSSLDSSSSFRAWRLAQERSLPPRLLGDSRPMLDDRARTRKEIVIENDIAWRVHAMVDFMFSQRVSITSTAKDPALRNAINRVLDAVWEASGGVALMQDMALLASVYGSVDLIVRAAPTLSPGEAPATTPDIEAIVNAARTGLRVEMIEPTRGVAILFPDDYRRIAAYVLRYRRSAQRETGPAATPGSEAREIGAAGASWGSGGSGVGGVGGVGVAEGSASTRPSIWRRVLAGLGAPSFEPAPESEITVTEVIGPRHTYTYERRPDGTHVQVAATPSLVSAERTDPQPPIVHIQNLSQPFRYEGLSEVEPLIPLQDELNIRLSDRANRVTMQSFRMFLAKGIDGATELPIAPNTVWSTDNPDAQITPFGGDVDAPSELEHIEQIREAMDKQSGVPPLASGVVRAKIGNLSSENALKVTLLGLLSKTSRKRVAFSHGIARASRLILEALSSGGVLQTSESDRDIRVDWPDPLPKDERQLLDAALKKIELGVPRERVLSELGYAAVDPGVE